MSSSRRGALLALAAAASRAAACTNLLIPAGSSDDGSTMLAYSADAADLYGDLSHWPAADHEPGELREIFSWDYGNRLGAIPQPPHTFSVVGNTNEHQLTIGETTFGGLSALSGEDGKAVCHPEYGCIDYAQLIWVTLQRAKTAREAIHVMDDLMQTYGYASEGESYSIADPHEVWMLEVIGKGNISRGTVWAAVRIPDGYAAAHANQARIRTFPRGDPDWALHSEDVVELARGMGLYNGTDEDFSFSDTYDPVTWSGARFCEARVYTFFEKVADPSENMHQYEDYIEGHNLTNRMPLYVKVGRKISLNETLWHMRNHYEGTPLDMTRDVGAGTWGLPTRMGEDLTWKYKNRTYFNERPIGTESAGWNMVGVQRANHKHGVLWFGVDDSTYSVHVPFYSSTQRVPAAWDGANCTGIASCRASRGLPGNIMNFSMKSMHWVTNMIANFAYSQHQLVSRDVQRKLVQLEGQLMAEVKEMDAKLAAMENEADATEAATDFSYQAAERMHTTWLEFYGTTFMTYVDGYVAKPDPTNEFSYSDKQTPGWSEEWRRSVVHGTGDRYRLKAQEGVEFTGDGRPMSSSSDSAAAAKAQEEPRAEALLGAAQFLAASPVQALPTEGASAAALPKTRLRSLRR